MGDAADDLREREESAYEMHIFGDCGPHCAYCFVEEQQTKRRIDEMESYDD